MTRSNNNHTKQRSRMPLIALAGGIVLVVAALAVGLGGRVKPEPTPTVQLVSTSQVERVSPEDARAAYDDNNAVFVDVRSAQAYAAGHIPGAINIPLGELETRISELNPDDWIITY